MKQKYKWLSRNIACPSPFLTLCLSEEELHHAVKSLKNLNLSLPSFPEGGACVWLYTNSKKESVALVALSKAAQDCGDGVGIAALLVHEAVHVWQQYIKDIGEDKPGYEQEAYGIQMISESLMKEYARRLKAQ